MCSGRPERRGEMRTNPPAFLALLFLGTLFGQTPSVPTGRIEFQVELITNGDRNPGESCNIVGVAANNLVASILLGRAARTEQVKFEVRDATTKCGVGPPATPDGPSGDPPLVPFLISELTLNAGFDPGAMDPGPASAFVVFMTVRSRRLSGFSASGQPLYAPEIMEQRATRMEHGEEYILPVLREDSQTRASMGIHEILLRVRVGWAGSEGATEYGAIEIRSAVPGSEVLVDRGVAGKVSANGEMFIPNLPVGTHEIRLRTASGVVARMVQVVKGRRVAVSPEIVGGAQTQPKFTAIGKNDRGFAEYRRESDGATMISIPEGEFLMGNLETEGKPLPHKVFVSGFMMDKLPVTVAQFNRFAAATTRPLPPDPYWGVHNNFPVAFVRWEDAKAYCEWAGGRLPTEAEREKATRGTDGRLWPWGNQPPPTPELAVFRRSWGVEGNDEVGVRPAGASPYGLLDTGGNMWEWCEDWYDPDYFSTSPYKDPRGPKTGTARVVKGGSWDSRPTVLSASSRNFGYIGYREGDFGFRCAADPPR